MDDGWMPSHLNLPGGCRAIVDDDVFPELSKYFWKFSGKGYVFRTTKFNGKVTYYALARAITGIQDTKLHIKHRNGDRLDFRRENLFVVANAGTGRRNPNGLYGVRPSKKGGFLAYVQIDKKTISLGSHDDQSEAIKVYDAVMRHLYGENAITNEKGTSLMTIEQAQSRLRQRVYGHKYLGVKVVGNKWRAIVRFIMNGRPRGRSLGLFDSEMEAALAYDVVARFYGQATNFTGSQAVSYEDWHDSRRKHPPKNKVKKGPSRFPGVTWAMSQQRWRARITVGGQYVYLGYFKTEDEAASAFREAQVKYGHATNSIRESVLRLSKEPSHEPRNMPDEHRFKVFINGAQERAMKYGCDISGDREAYRQFILSTRAADVAFCYWCGIDVPKPDRRIDHIIPMARGGPDDVMNLCCSCNHCNAAKCDKMPEEFCGQYELPFITPKAIERRKAA